MLQTFFLSFLAALASLELAHCCAIFLCYLGMEKYHYRYPNSNDRYHLAGRSTIGDVQSVCGQSFKLTHLRGLRACSRVTLSVFLKLLAVGAEAKLSELLSLIFPLLKPINLLAQLELPITKPLSSLTHIIANLQRNGCIDQRQYSFLSHLFCFSFPPYSPRCYLQVI